MAREAAEVRGRATVRPYRVGQLVDTTSAQEVRAAIANLSVSWGGIFTPILDVNRPFDDIESQARIFDVDALHLEAEGGALVDRLRQERWLWGPGGRFGPFAQSETGFRTGVLLARFLALPQPPLLLPEWSPSEPLNMFYTAAFGTQSHPDPTASNDLEASWEPDGSSRVGLGYVYVTPTATVDDVGIIQTTKVGLSPKPREYLDWMNGLFVVCPDHVPDVVASWNIRSYGRSIIPVPAEGPAELLSFLTRGTLPQSEPLSSGSDAGPQKQLNVWGLEHASEQTRDAIGSMAERLEMRVVGQRRDPAQQVVFPGLESGFSSSVRAAFPPNAQSVTVRVPSVPLESGVPQNDPSSFLKAQPDWKPTLGSTAGEFTMADLLTIAAVRA